MTLKKLFFTLGLVLMLLPMACTEKESDLGVDLQDPFTAYEGTRDTAVISACTIFDDSLSTSGYTAAVFGHARDNNFGSVEAVLYSQIATGSDGVNITDAVIIDSVVMTLIIDTVYPVLPDSTPRPMHIVVNQLAEQLLSDSAYYSFNRLAESSNVLFDSTVTYYADSLRLRMRLSAMEPILRQSCTQQMFLERSKGMAIHLEGEDNMMVTVDLSATDTRLTVYYHTEGSDQLQFLFTINSDAAHSMYYSHDYSGTPLAAFANNHKDSIEGTQRLYLEPLGGTRIRLNMGRFVKEFRESHPSAVIHYAELILPVSEEANEQTPVRILALKRAADGSSAYITDANVLTNSYTYSGFDGYYDSEKHQYRLRVSRHLQELLRTGKDYGTELIIDARRSSAFRTIINGTATDNPIRVDFIYSE